MPQATPDKVDVLIVTGDNVMWQTWCRWFRDTRYRVECVGDAQAAMMAIQNRRPQFCLIDEETSHTNRDDLFRCLRTAETLHRVYVILIKTDGLTPDQIESAEPEVDDFVCKPVAEGELFARLRSGMRLLTMEHQLTRLAKADALTGLPNRRAFLEQLRREWARADRQRVPLCCVMLDIDFMKSTNDLRGHLAGDEMLRQVAARLLENSRAGDFVCRFGGDEFCVLLPETNEHGGAVWAERIRTELAAIKLVDRDDQLSLTASFGVAERSSATRTAEQLVDFADQALLEAKRKDRNRVVCYRELQSNKSG